MKNKIYKILAVVCYIIPIVILFFTLNSTKLILNTSTKIIFILLSSLLIYIGGLIFVKKLKYSKKILKLNLILYFLIYIVTICSLTLFDEIYGRQGLILIEWDSELLNRYLKNSFNIIPFETIKLFTNGYINNIVSFKNFSINILGNLFAFMPYGFFLPMIFKSMRKYYKFLIAMIIIVIIIELLQFVTMSGSCDIDDLILNVMGASIIYFIFKIKCINKFMHKIFLWE